jgi:hypothetical protein
MPPDRSSDLNGILTVSQLSNSNSNVINACNKHILLPNKQSDYFLLTKILLNTKKYNHNAHQQK